MRLAQREDTGDFTPTTADEKDVYQLLEPLPGLDAVDTKSTDYISGIYNILLTLCVVFALIMIVIAGVQYTTSWASPSNKSEAKGRIGAALGGLVLALISVLILNTINPDILGGAQNVIKGEPVDGSGNARDGGGNASGIPNTGDAEEGADLIDPGSDGGVAGGMSEKEARDYLEGKIEVNKLCTTTSCPTKLAGIKKSTLDEIIKLKDECKCDPVITAGTESGHSTKGTHTHSNGYKADLRLSEPLNNYVTTSGNFTRGSDRGDGAQTWVKNGTNGKVVYYKESNHWDVSVKPA